MKKILFVIIPALVLALAVFTGCGGASDEENVQATADKFLTALADGDIETVKSVCDPELFETNGALALFANLTEEMKTALLGEMEISSLTDKTQQEMQAFVDKYLQGFLESYEIKDVSVEEDKATVTASVTYGFNPDKVAEIDTSNIMSEEDLQKYAQEHAAELQEFVNNNDQEGFYNKVLDDLMGDLLNKYYDKIMATGQKTEDASISLQKKDDTWYIEEM